MQTQAIERVEDVVLPYELLPWQQKVKDDPHRFKTIPAGRRSGKTHLLCDMLIEAATTYAAGLPCWYVAPTYGMAKEIAWSVLKWITQDLRRAGVITRYHETELRIDFINGSSIHLKGAENQDGLRGRGLGFLGIDEIALMKKEVWQLVLRPAISDHEAPVVFIGTPKGYNYFFDLCEMEKAQPEIWKMFHIKTAEAGTISEAELEQARADMDVQSYRQEYEASFEVFAGQVYQWEINVPRPPQDFSYDEIFYGGDFGYSVDPTAVVRIYRKADKFWVEEVIYRTKLTNQALGNEMGVSGIAKNNGAKVGASCYYDSAEPKSIQELIDAGFNVIPSLKGPDSRRAGVDFIKSLDISILKGSENILNEYRSYCYKEDKDGNDLPEPVKFNDHAMDAIRYGIYTHLKLYAPSFGIATESWV